MPEVSVAEPLLHFNVMSGDLKQKHARPRLVGIESLSDRAPDGDSKNSLRAWLYLLKCAKRLEQEMSDRFREQFQSSLSRFDVLAHLDLAGEKGLSTSQLAGRLLASKGNITRLLDRMAQDGLLERRGDDADRRVNKIRLSAGGAELFARMAPAHEKWSHEILGSTGSGDRDTLVTLLRQLRDHLESRR
ncbi:MAG: MarR family transcriptional regulator [Gammaproteobacteria bacterium]|nr:MarR family transcriptional regulator [Gammaproteobacteria bacterium]